MKALFFSLHAGNWLHAFPEALVAEALKQDGMEILYVTCSGELSDYCICMASSGLKKSSPKKDKERICQRCSINKKIIRQEFGFDGYDIGEVVSDEDWKSLSDIMVKTTQANAFGLVLDGIPVGRIALYELLLNHKKIDLNFLKDEWDAYRVALQNTLVSFYASRRILDQERPDRVLTYNGLYSVNRVCCELARARGIPVYFLHAGANLAMRLQTIMVARDGVEKYLEVLRGAWQKYKDQPCSLQDMRFVTAHFLELLKGRHFLTYSPGKKGRSVNMREFFGIGQGKKVLVAVMSSYDERFAFEMSGAFSKEYKLFFPRQKDWIQALLDFMKTRDDLFLIIRVHPRDFPNKREYLKSDHARMLEQELRDLPDNVRVNWPSDGISLYDLAEEASVFLNAWSTAGEEMALLGIPVVIYSSDLVTYPAELNFLGVSREDYFKKIEQALEDGWSFERVRMLYRWHALRFNAPIIRFPESFSVYSAGIRQKSLMRRVWERACAHVMCLLSSEYRKMFHVRRQVEDCRRRARSLCQKDLVVNLVREGKSIFLECLEAERKGAATFDQETRSLKQELKRLGVAVKGMDRLRE